MNDFNQVSAELLGCENASLLLDEPIKRNKVQTFFAWMSYPLVIVFGMGFAFWMADSLPELLTPPLNRSIFDTTILGYQVTLGELELHKCQWCYLRSGFIAWSAFSAFQKSGARSGSSTSLVMWVYLF